MSGSSSSHPQLDNGTNISAWTHTSDNEGAWSTYVTDGYYSECYVVSGVTAPLLGKGLSFNLPSGAVVTGIVATVHAGTAGPAVTNGLTISLTDDNGTTQSKTGNLPSGGGVGGGSNVTFGSDTDSWGLSTSSTKYTNLLVGLTAVSNNYNVDIYSPIIITIYFSTTSVIETSLAVQDVTGLAGETVDLTAVLQDQYNNELSGQNVSFSVNGITLGFLGDCPDCDDCDDCNPATNNDGVASIEYQIDPDATPGTVFPIIATFNGSSTYGSSTNTGNLWITVQPAGETTTNTGYILPTAVSQYSPAASNNSTNWDNLSEIESYDGVATIDTSAIVTPTQNGGISQCILGLNYPLDIPYNATIDGIEVVIGRELGGTVVSIYDKSVYLYYQNATIGTNHASPSAWSPTYDEAEYGGNEDLWGAVLTPGILNDPTFGVMLQVINNNPSWNVAGYVDSIRMNVTYTTAQGYTATLSGNICFQRSFSMDCPDCDCDDCEGDYTLLVATCNIGNTGIGAVTGFPTGINELTPITPVGTQVAMGQVGPFPLYNVMLTDALKVERRDDLLSSAFRGPKIKSKRQEVIENRSFDIIVEVGRDFEMLGLVDLNEMIPINGSAYLAENVAMGMRGYGIVNDVTPKYQSPIYSRISITPTVLTNLNNRLVFDHTNGLNDGTLQPMSYTPGNNNTILDMVGHWGKFNTFFNTPVSSPGLAEASFKLVKNQYQVVAKTATEGYYGSITATYKDSLIAPFGVETQMFTASSATPSTVSDQNDMDNVNDFKIWASDFQLMINAVANWIENNGGVNPTLVYLRQGGVKQDTYVSWTKYELDMLVRWNTFISKNRRDPSYIWINDPAGNTNIAEISGLSVIDPPDDGTIRSIFIETANCSSIDTDALINAGITDIYVEIPLNSSIPASTTTVPSAISNLLTTVFNTIGNTGINVHAWLPLTGYVPGNSTTDTYALNTITALANIYQDLSGIVIDEYQWAGQTGSVSALQTPNGNIAVQQFHKAAYDIAHNQNNDLQLTIAFLPDIQSFESTYIQDYYFGVNIKMLDHYCDVFAPLTFTGDHTEPASWINNVTIFIIQYSNKPIVPILETYISSGNTTPKTLSEMVTEAQNALLHSGGFGLFRYGIGVYPSVASNRVIVLPSDLGVGTGWFIGNDDISINPSGTTGIRARLVTNSEGNNIVMDSYNQGIYTNLKTVSVGAGITWCNIAAYVDGDQCVSIWVHTEAGIKEILTKVPINFGTVSGLRASIYTDTQTTVEYLHGYTDFIVKNPTYDYANDITVHNIIIAPPGNMNIKPDFYRISRYGPLPCYINVGTNPIANEPLTFTIDPRKFYDGTVKLWDSGVQVLNTNHNWYNSETGVIGVMSMDNGLTKLDVDSENNLITLYAFNHGWNLVNTFSIGEIYGVVPTFISSEEITIQINETTWNLKRGKCSLSVNHQFDDIQYTQKEWYFHDDSFGGAAVEEIKKVNQPVAMKYCFYANIYNTHDLFRLQIMKTLPQTINTDSIPADNNTGIGWYYSEETNTYDQYDYRAKEWLYQPQTGIKY
jgi:hypothetical protein